MKPYVGITDFMTFDQVQRMKEVFTLEGYQLHVGVMMSFKTLHGKKTRWEKAFPPKNRIIDVFADEEVYNCLHYADFGKDKALQDSLASATFFAGPRCDALQLDMCWPSPLHIQAAPLDGLEVILQLGHKAMGEIDHDLDRMVEKLKKYRPVIHRVLLDLSGGRGIPLDAEGMIPQIELLQEHFPEWGIGVAGGLGPGQLHLIKPLVKRFPGVLSFDAQSRLRPSHNAMDPVDWEMAKQYLEELQEILA